MLEPRALRVLSRELREGSLSAEDLIEGYMDRIAEREPEVQAWAWIDFQAAREAARQADALPEKGPLHGIPVGVKDVIDTVAMPTSYGSPIYGDHRPAADAAAIATIRSEGGLVIGKTVTCEFAGAHPSKTRNPIRANHTPGGSSSGSAAAVAAGMVPVALGTQTAGSIIRPASFCGVVGYKPTFGVINRAGVKPLSESFDTIGFFARTVDDAGWFAGTMTRRPALTDNTAMPHAPRLLLCRTDKWDVADADGKAALEHAARLLRIRGAQIRETEAPISSTAVIDLGMKVLAYEARQSFAHELRHAPHLLSDKMHELMTKSDGLRPDTLDAAQAELERTRAALDLALANYDALITLSAPGEAPAGLHSTGNASFNAAWTFLHSPTISVPGLSGFSGLPIGIQLVGRRHHDAKLLAAARWAERALASCSMKRLSIVR
jgi:Asp-tRNA(Asn)/Glu-tRNA(Gln) amidotransferase A subunit family amidase